MLLVGTKAASRKNDLLKLVRIRKTADERDASSIELSYYISDIAWFRLTRKESMVGAFRSINVHRCPIESESHGVLLLNQLQPESWAHIGERNMISIAVVVLGGSVWRRISEGFY